MRIQEIIEKSSQDLPIIRPIKEFIHLNLLLPYQHLNFWDALKLAGNKLNAFPFSDLNFYREKLKSEEISKKLLSHKLNSLKNPEEKRLIEEFIFQGNYDYEYKDQRYGRLHDEWSKALKVNIADLADGMLIKWVSLFLDQGIAHWQIPGAETKTFYHCIRDLLLTSKFLPDPFSRGDLLNFFPENPVFAIEYHLPFLCPKVELREEYLQESIFTLRGWAGLVKTLENYPELIPFHRDISLLDFIALKLILERAWIEKENYHKISPTFLILPNLDKIHSVEDYIFRSFRILQESFEETTISFLLDALKQHIPPRKTPSKYQFVFCMDDRECSIRRHLEKSSQEIETFGTAGHFGIEAVFLHPDDSFPKKHCPAPLIPKYFLKEKFLVNKKIMKSSDLNFSDIQPDGNVFVDFFLSYLKAFFSVMRLFKNLFLPLLGISKANVFEEIPATDINIVRTNNETENNLLLGFNVDEMTSVVFNQLQQIGLVDHFADLIFIVGHTSSSVNNPYFVTYGCGACSGRSGLPNARVFAQMCNSPQVRKALKDRYEFIIPESTIFLPSLHDTCKDVFHVMMDINLTENLKKSFSHVKEILDHALKKNAQERCQKFKQVTYHTLNRDAHKEVLKRSLSLFETRPELGHTNVAFALVGKRDHSLGLDLKRRAFLQSYDRKLDPDGKILANILGAVIPVCSGINLDYYFSRVDNLRFGAGSKLPQNVVGNIGLSHGTESDLLFGLPFQMIDQHNAVRLLVIVEQDPQVALKVLNSNPLVKQIVYNNWVFYGAYDEFSGNYYLFENGQMSLYNQDY